MWNRLKNHLIWTPEDFPFIRQSWTKTELADWNRPSGLVIPPERIDFYKIGQWRCGQPRTTPFSLKIRTQLCRKQNPIFPFIFLLSLSLSKTHYSSSSYPLHPSFPPKYLAPSTLVYGFGLPSPESSRKYTSFKASRRLIFRSSQISTSSPHLLLIIYHK